MVWLNGYLFPGPNLLYVGKTFGKSGERKPWGVLGDAGDDILGQMEVVL